MRAEGCAAGGTPPFCRASFFFCHWEFVPSANLRCGFDLEGGTSVISWRGFGLRLFGFCRSLFFYYFHYLYFVVFFNFLFMFYVSVARACVRARFVRACVRAVRLTFILLVLHWYLQCCILFRS